ncbi:MAG: mannose-6-phosphate isomerase, class I [Spirochaetales bacterium]|uniref:mannose-6-phosphate isomerase n=1 Tax=Candidatus Thalassospirochaeta sargassi TaxID=3119039 RepID=A0AAJ1IHP0_9SPIO|nr:mannose-6-phosphate isomerase, class I [Spirochaetales bacterium]
MAVYKLTNQILKYAWGSKTLMPELLGYDNSENEPMAELWMGAHPKASSDVHMQNGDIPLDEMISKSPETVLGGRISNGFSGRLPFLFKVLAAGSPLSIQAHPTLDEAAAGWARENEAGIALDAFNRNYKDDNHKPEIICALSEYHAMRGFRQAGVIAANFRKIMIPELDAAVSALEAASASPAGDESSVSAAVSAALKNFFTVIMQLSDIDRTALVGKALEKAENEELPDSRWIKRFAELYPGDIGIVSPLYLNIVTLQPGEAMYLPAGELHAYLEGIGMELMANSDNVLRGGLTPKHVDVPELLSTLNFNPTKPEILNPVKLNNAESAYITPAPEFYLSKIDLSGGYELPVESYGPEPPSIFICTEGSAIIEDSTSDSSVEIMQGETAFASFGSRMKLQGRAVIYRASVPAAGVVK